MPLKRDKKISIIISDLPKKKMLGNSFGDWVDVTSSHF